MTAVYIAIGTVAVLLLSLILLYNGLVRARNTVDESWSGVDVQLKRRHDLVGNLIESVKGYAAHERATLQAVTDARAAAVLAGGPAGAARAEAALDGPVGALMAIAEAYPDLKASENFMQLQNELSDLETQIAASRRIYNGNVRAYNDRIQSFPGMLVARPFGFSAREYFEIDAAEIAAPVVTVS
ncbi:MAG: LemA family protein [Vicinamibacterales bacterium]|nr:LemA family protein [Vicinamibacterales bacterium]